MVRLGNLNDINEVNVIRKQVTEMHVKGEPDIFKCFTKELAEEVKGFIDSESKMLLILQEDEKICGYAMIEHITKPETMYMYKREFIQIDELGVLDTYRNKGYGKQLVNKVMEIARSKNIRHIELNAWSFNGNAIGFYKNLGFETYREHFRINL